MPIHDIICAACGHAGETLQLGTDPLSCPTCGSTNVEKKLSATSSLTGKAGMTHPGHGDHGCCGSTPGHAGCAGPGSCCGKKF